MVKTTLDSILLAILGVSGSGTSAVGLAGITATGNAGSLDTNTLVPLGLFLGGVFLTASLVWRAATRTSGVENEISRLRDRIERLERKARERKTG
jgi:hypothetical protein